MVPLEIEAHLRRDLAIAGAAAAACSTTATAWTKASETAAKRKALTERG